MAKNILNRKVLLPVVNEAMEMLLHECKDIYTENTGLDVSDATIQSLKWLDWCKHNSSHGRSFKDACRVTADINTNTHEITINRKHHGETQWLKYNHTFIELAAIILHELNHRHYHEHDDKFYDGLSKAGVSVGELSGSLDAVGGEYRKECIDDDCEMNFRLSELREQILDVVTDGKYTISVYGAELAEWKIGA